MKDLNISVKKWFDKVNGNTYFAALITIDNKESILLPFQYGYGSQWEQEAKAVLTQQNRISCEYGQNLKNYCKENNIYYSYQVYDNCKKSELKQLK